MPYMFEITGLTDRYHPTIVTLSTGEQALQMTCFHRQTWARFEDGGKIRIMRPDSALCLKVVVLGVIVTPDPHTYVELHQISPILGWVDLQLYYRIPAESERSEAGAGRPDKLQSQVNVKVGYAR